MLWSGIIFSSPEVEKIDSTAASINCFLTEVRFGILLVSYVEIHHLMQATISSSGRGLALSSSKTSSKETALIIPRSRNDKTMDSDASSSGIRGSRLRKVSEGSGKRILGTSRIPRVEMRGRPLEGPQLKKAFSSRIETSANGVEGRKVKNLRA